MAFSYEAFSACVSDRWQFVIGDPNLTGWAVAATYAIAAATAVMVLLRRPFDPVQSRQLAMLWGLIAVLMTVLALNKQLDLQSLMTALGRCLAQEQGWYENRRLVQRDFILGLIAAAVLISVAMFWILRGIIRQNLLVLAGLASLAGFILIRAGHLLHVFVPDQIFADLLLHRATSILEMACPVLIIIAAWRLLRLQPLQTSP